MRFLLSKRNAETEWWQEIVRKPFFLGFPLDFCPTKEKKLALLCATRLRHDDGKCLPSRGKSVALFVVSVLRHEKAFLSRLCDSRKKEQRNPCRVKAKGTTVGPGVLLFHYFLTQGCFNG